MSLPAKEEYKFKKGDNLDAIAKTHGLKDGSVIWKLPDNKAIASKRGKPEQLQPGDMLVIPPSEKEMKEAQHAAQKAVDALDGEIKRTNEKITVIDKLEGDIQTSMLSCIKELESKKGQVKSWGNTADAVAMIAQVHASLGKMTLKAYQGAEKVGEDLLKMNKELLSEAASMTTSPLESAAAKALEPCEKSTNTAVIFVGSLAKSFGQMTSPSFWANTTTQLLAGKSWSDAVVSDISDEFDTQARQIRQQMADQLKSLEDHKKQIASHLGDLQNQRKQAEAGLKALQH